MQGKGFLLLFDSISDACWPEQSQQTKVPNSLFNPLSSPRMWKTKQTTFWEKKKRDQTSLAPASAGAARVPPAAPVSAALPSPARAAALQNKHTDRATNTLGLLFPFGRGGIAGRSLGKHGGTAVLSIRSACRFLNVVWFFFKWFYPTKEQRGFRSLPPWAGGCRCIPERQQSPWDNTKRHLRSLA